MGPGTRPLRYGAMDAMNLAGEHAKRSPRPQERGESGIIIESVKVGVVQVTLLFW